MNDAKRRFFLSGLKLLDTSQLVLSFGLATILLVQWDQRSTLQHFLSVRVKLSNCAVFASILLAWRVIFSLCGLYRSRRLSTRGAELADVLKAAGFASILLALLAEVFRIRMITSGFLLAFWFLSSFLLVNSRIMLRPALAIVRKRGRNLRNMVVLGQTRRAIDFARTIQNKPELGYRLLGFVDDDWHGMAEFRQTGFPLVASYRRTWLNFCAATWSMKSRCTCHCVRLMAGRVTRPPCAKSTAFS